MRHSLGWQFRLATQCQRRISSSSSSSSSSSPSEAPSAAAVHLGDAVNALSRQRRGNSSVGGRSFLKRLVPSPGAGGVGLFGIPELAAGSTVGFRRLQSDAAETVARLLGEALDDDAGDSSGRGRPMVRILDDMSDAVCRVADMADCVRQLHPSAEYRAAAEDACVAIATLVESLNTNRRLYERLLVAVRDPGAGGDAARFRTDDVDARVGELLIWDFLQSGVHLDLESGAGERFVALCERAFVLGARFGRGAMRPAALGDGRQLLEDAAGEHPDAAVRRRAFAAYYAAMPEQEATLSELLSTRLEIARLAGFASFADRANAGCLLDTAGAIDGFLGGLANRLAPRVAMDAVAMRRLNGGVEPGAWDFVHLVNRATAACFQDSPSVANGVCLDEFLSIGACLRGVAHVAERLFDVRLHLVADDDGCSDVWDGRVFKLSVRRRCRGADEELGRIYCDFFPRAGKPVQDCHFTIRGGRQGPPRQLPVVCLQLQCPDPAGASAPSLLTPCHVENLFHEFGHALHSVLGCTRYQHVTGTRCSTDLAEVPSTLMEMFAFQPCVLREYARHWRTGEPMPERLYAPLRASRRVLPAAGRQQQVLYSMLDSRLHSPSPPPVGSTPAAFHELATGEAMRGLPAYPPGTAWHHRFTHLVGYGAKYHAYLVSKAIASLVWSTRFARDPLCSAAGRDLERRLLSRGGEETTVAMVTELTGRPATAESLAESLVADVVECQSGPVNR